MRVGAKERTLSVVVGCVVNQLDLTSEELRSLILRVDGVLWQVSQINVQDGGYGSQRLTIRAERITPLNAPEAPQVAAADLCGLVTKEGTICTRKLGHRGKCSALVRHSIRRNR